MLLIFHRQVQSDKSVMANVTGILEGKTYQIGQITFPNTLLWSRFIGALQRGALAIRDLEIRLENISPLAEEEPIAKSS